MSPFMKSTLHTVCLVLITNALTSLAPVAKAEGAPSGPPQVELPKSIQSGAKIRFELWSWGEDEAERKKLLDLKDGDRIPMEGLPDNVQFRFLIPAEHNGLVFKARSA